MTSEPTPARPPRSGRGEADEPWREVVPHRAPPPPPEGDAHAQLMHELRGLLVGPEQQRLEQLESRAPAVDADEVARVLPDAVRRRVVRDGELAGALEETIEDGLQSSARKNPQAIADAIYPALGPAIRKSIQAALSQALEGFNSALENSFSPRGLAWRLEALRTGRPFAEVVLLKSLVYRVEQVFLIHRETGVLLCEAASPEAQRRDPELVSSMLGAIRDFVVESFGGSPDDELDSIDLADLRIVLVGAPDTVLAAVVRGNPPAHLRATLVDAHEEVSVKCGPALARFEGDCAPFEANAHVLEGCLGGELREQKRSPLVPLVAPALGLLLLGWLGWVLWQGHQERSAAARVVDALREAPGLVVLGVEEAGDRRVVHGLRDPAADAPLDVARAAEAGLDADAWTFDFTRWDAPGAAFLEARVRRAVDPPPGVELTVDEAGVVRLAGEAERAWIEGVRRRVPGLPGVERLDLADLEDVDLEHLEQLAEDVGRLRLRFPLGRADVDPGDALTADLAASVADLGGAAARAGRFVRIELVPQRHRDEDPAPDLALRRLAATRDLLSAPAGPWLLFEPRLAVDGDDAVGESGAVRVLTEVLAGDGER